MTLKTTLLLALAASLTACATVEPPPTISRGDKPTPEVLKDAVLERLKRDLRDFDSLKDFAILQGPVEATAGYGMGGLEHLWFTCVEYNAKNAYGGYVGIKKHPMYFRTIQGELVHIAPVGWNSIDKTC